MTSESCEAGRPRVAAMIVVLLSALFVLDHGARAADVSRRSLSVCPPPPPLAILNAPSIVGAGSPNRVANMATIAGATYAWTITNGTITSGQGTSQISFTAGVAGTLLTLNVSIDLNGCPFGGGFADVTVAPAGSAVQYYTMATCRLVDTRGADGPLGGPALDPAGAADRSFVLTGTCGIPPEATSVSVNVTVVSGSGGGTLSIYRGDGAVTGTSTIGFAAMQTRANNSVLQLALDGTGMVKVNSTAAGPVHLVLDANGFFQ